MQKLFLYFLFLVCCLIAKTSYSAALNNKPIQIPNLPTSEMSLNASPTIKIKLDTITAKLRLTKKEKPPERYILIDPVKHSWKAFSADGKLVRSGLATAGGKWCPDIGRPCKTKAGVFRINSLGSSSCVSKIYPVNKGGAKIPYCMYFNGGQGIHGSNQVVPGNVSHGCVRVHTSDARWLRFNFVNVGTKVIVKAY